MKAVVLGGGGFIGSHVAASLAEQGHSVKVVDIHFPALRQEWWQKATVNKHDLRLKDRAVKAVDGADFVFHFAADMGGVGYFHSAADAPAATTNMRIDLNVLEACKQAGTPFFYASSACAYPVTGQTHDGEHELAEGLLGQGPADQLYGEEKRFMTLLCEQEPLARVGVFHTVYGPGQEWEGPRTKFPPAICRKVKDGGEIEIWGDGSQVRTFLFIDDAVKRIFDVAFGAYGGAVNIGSDEQVTVRGCAEGLCDHAGVDPVFRFDSSKPTGVAARASDNTIFYERYGQCETVSAADGLGRLFDWLP